MILASQVHSTFETKKDSFACEPWWDGAACAPNRTCSMTTIQLTFLLFSNRIWKEKYNPK